MRPNLAVYIPRQRVSLMMCAAKLVGQPLFWLERDDRRGTSNPLCARRALAALASWLQLYTLGDPEGAEAELADDLAAIHRDAFPKAGKAGAVPPISSLPCPSSRTP